MKKKNLIIVFIYPNTAEVTADYILKVFIEANSKKVERIMQEMAGRSLERTSKRENKRF